MLYTVSEQIKQFYDKASVDKIRDYIYGNARVDMAWSTIDTHVINPKNVLEIGCGIGSMCNRINLRWPAAEIIGIDISEKSVEIAQKLFETTQCKFYTTIPKYIDDKKKFDLILLIDVIEHVEKSNRAELIAFIESNLSEEGLLLLAFPTPHMLNINRKYFPEKLQPIEEDIFMADLQEISRLIKKALVLYKEVFVWEQRDYAHAIFANELRENVNEPIFVKKLIKEKLKGKLRMLINKSRPQDFIKEKRGRVVDKLGPDFKDL